MGTGGDIGYVRICVSGMAVGLSVWNDVGTDRHHFPHVVISNANSVMSQDTSEVIGRKLLNGVVMKSPLGQCHFGSQTYAKSSSRACYFKVLDLTGVSASEANEWSIKSTNSWIRTCNNNYRQTNLWEEVLITHLRLILSQGRKTRSTSRTSILLLTSEQSCQSQMDPEQWNIKE